LPSLPSFVSQHHTGTLRQICRNERCPVHGEPIQESKQRSERATKSSNDWQEQHRQAEAKRKAELEARQAEAKRKAELEARQRAAKAIIDQASDLDVPALNMLHLNELLENCRNVDKDRLASMMTARGISVRPTANSWEASAGAKAQLMLWAREEAATYEVQDLVTELLISNRIAASPDRRIKFADEAKPESDADTYDDAEEVEDELGFDALKFAAEELSLDWERITAPPAESKAKGKKKAKA
jgi:hypothetical protein